MESCDLVHELEGLDSKTLPKKYLLNIKRAVCRVEILRGESNIAMKYELFKRLNSGGSQLKAQEIRNAIYRGYGSKVNNLIEKLSMDSIFIEYTNLTDRKKFELYDQELILRFLAFYNNTDSINDNTAKFLDKFILKATQDPNYNCQAYETLFYRVMRVISSLGDKSIFKTDGNNFVAAYFESIVVFVAENIDFYEHNVEVLKGKIAQLKSSADFAIYMGSASNSKSRTVKRLEIAKKIFKVE